MTQNALVVPEKTDVPAHLRDPKLAALANEDASAGISAGMPARVKISGKQFHLVSSAGEETVYPANKMVPDSDGNPLMPIIILRAKKALTKTWYASAFNPNVDAQAPDCFSHDGERPHPSVANPQNDVCASCAMNAFGSGKDNAGNPTQGKACADTKIVAALVPGFGVHHFKIPPASLKNFGGYVRQLSSSGIPLGAVTTLVGFDPMQSFGVYVFRFGGFLDEKHIPKLIELAESADVEEIINPQAVSTAALAASPQTEAQPAQAPPAQAPPAQAPPAQAPPAQAPPAQPDLAADLGTTTAQPQAETPKEAAGPAISDEDLIAELDL